MHIVRFLVVFYAGFTIIVSGMAASKSIILYRYIGNYVRWTSLLHDVDNLDDRFTSACLSVISFLMERIFPLRNRDDLQLLVLTLPRDQDVHVSYYEPRARQVIKARQRESIIPLDMDNYSVRIYIWCWR